MTQSSSLSEVFKRELKRKAWHLPVFGFPLLALYSRPLALIVLITLAFGYVVLYFLKNNFHIEVPFFSRVISACSRGEGFDPGPLYLAISFIICVFCFEARDIFFGASVVVVSDGLAALVGRLYGRKVFFSGSKSWEGSTAFFVSCMLVGLFFLSPVEAVTAALILVCSEALLTKGLDNLFLPVVAQLLLVWFRGA